MKINAVRAMIIVSLVIMVLYVIGLFLPIIKNTKDSKIEYYKNIIININVWKKKEYYREEMEKSIDEKIKVLKNQKYFTAGSIILMFLVLLVMFFILGN